MPPSILPLPAIWRSRYCPGINASQRVLGPLPTGSDFASTPRSAEFLYELEVHPQQAVELHGSRVVHDSTIERQPFVCFLHEVVSSCASPSAAKGRG